MLCCLVSSRAFRRYPICRHCSGGRLSTHIGALCLHGTKNNQHNSSTQPRWQPRTMSGGICSDDERYGGFGAAMANSLAVYSAAPARVVAAVTAARAPLPVAAAHCGACTPSRRCHRARLVNKVPLQEQAPEKVWCACARSAGFSSR
jgi:hypothetical protein